MSDLARLLAFAFRRKGADVIAGSELRHLLAFDLRWFAPEDAKRVVHRAVEVGLLVAEGDALRPSFDTAAVDVPVNFRPSLAALDEDAPASLPRATRPAAAVRAPELPPGPAPLPAPPPARVDPIARAAEDERRRRGLLIDLETARLVIRRRAGEDVAADAAAAEARLLP